MINSIYSNNLSLSYHTSVFFILSLSEALYLRFLVECVNAIYLALHLKHTYTHTPGCTSSSLLFISMFYYVKHESMLYPRVINLTLYPSRIYQRLLS